MTAPAVALRRTKLVAGIVAGKSASQAAREAGYAESTAATGSHRMSRSVEVRASLQAVQEHIWRETLWTPVAVVLKAAELMARAEACGDWPEARALLGEIRQCVMPRVSQPDQGSTVINQLLLLLQGRPSDDLRALLATPEE